MLSRFHTAAALAALCLVTTDGRAAASVAEQPGHLNSTDLPLWLRVRLAGGVQ